MNELGRWVIWLALQVTLFVVVLSVVYLMLRRLGPRTGAAVACAALFGITVITVSLFLPWPRWHLVHSQPENPEIAKLRTEGISSTADPPKDRPSAEMQPRDYRRDTARISLCPVRSTRRNTEHRAAQIATSFHAGHGGLAPTDYSLAPRMARLLRHGCAYGCVRPR